MNIVTAAKNWGHVAVRASFWGPFSVAFGRFTGGKASYWAMHRWCVGCSDGLGIRRSLINGERLDPERQCVYIANHLSLLDILVLGSYLEGDYRWLSKDAIFKVPFMGWHMKSAGHVPVYRGKKRHLNRDLPQRLRNVVAEGASLFFFPEGTRSPNGKLQPFKLGAFHAANDNDVPVVPLVIRGTEGLLKKGARDLAIDHNRQCSITVLPEIVPVRALDDSEEARRDAAVELCANAVRAIATELNEPVPGVLTDTKELLFAEKRMAAG